MVVNLKAVQNTSQPEQRVKVTSGSTTINKTAMPRYYKHHWSRAILAISCFLLQLSQQFA